MNKYSHFTNIEATVDLHNLNGPGRPILPHDVWSKIDQFLQQTRLKFASKIKRGYPVKVGIIVGKGTRSKNFINGKNPLRAFTEDYLDQTGLNWRNGRYAEGEDGVIVVDLE